MKQKFLVILLLFVGCTKLLIAQDNQIEEDDETNTERSEDFNIFKSNELKINTFSLVFATPPNLTYEKIINKHSFGLAVGYSFGKITSDQSDLREIQNYEIELLILPYYRYHFGNKLFRKFFIEANTIYLKEHEKYTVNRNLREASYNSYGIGGSIGFKFIRMDGWLVDLTLGYTRILNRSFIEGTFGNSYPRIAILFGKRF